MSVVVVCSHLLDEGHFRSERFPVAPVLCHGPLDYWAGLRRFWNEPVTIVNVEHDVEVTDEHIAALLDDPTPLASWAYYCHWASTGLPHDVIAAGTGEHFAADQHYLQGGEEWANWSAIGLVKIAPEARIGPLRAEPWQRLELAVHDAVKRPWHMLWGPDGVSPGVDHWHY